MPYPTLTHTPTHQGLLLSLQNPQLTRSVPRTNVTKRAAVARAATAHVAYGEPCQGAGHWCRVDMHSILPSHSPPRSMHIAHTAKNPPECWLFGYVYAQTSLHSTGQCFPIAPGELRHGARCWCGADVHTLPARARTFMYQAHHTRKLNNPSDHGWFEEYR